MWYVFLSFIFFSLPVHKRNGNCGVGFSVYVFFFLGGFWSYTCSSYKWQRLLEGVFDNFSFWYVYRWNRSLFLFNISPPSNPFVPFSSWKLNILVSNKWPIEGIRYECWFCIVCNIKLWNIIGCTKILFSLFSVEKCVHGCLV